MPPPLVEDVARRLGTSPEDARRALRAFSSDLRREARRTGAVHVPALGTLRATEDGFAFEPAETLTHAANRRLAGMEALPARPAAPASDGSAPDGRAPADARDGAQGGAGSDAEAPRPEAARVHEAPAPEEAALEEAAPERASEVEDEPRPSDARQSDGRLPTPWAPYAVLLDDPLRNHDLVDSDFVGARLLPMDAPAGPVRPPKRPQRREPEPEAPPAEAAPITTERAPATRNRRPAWPWVAGLLAVLLAAVVAWFALSQTDAPPAPPPEDPTVAEETTPPAAEEEPPPAADAASPDAEPTAPAAGASASPPTEAEPLAPLGFERAAGTWAIVVSSKTARGEALPVLRDFRGHLSSLPFALDVVESTTEAGTRYRVAVGPFDSFEAARTALQQHAAQLPEGAWLLEIEP